MRAAGILIVTLCFGLTAQSDAVHFNRHIRPILSDRCFACHGPDAKARKAKLRLDTFEGATADRGGYAALVPGKPRSSRILQRLRHPSPKKRMPPAKSKLRVSNAEIALIEQWIAQGGRYTKHWAFVPPQKTAPPAAARAGWDGDSIDRFVLAGLERQGLSPAPPATRPAWLRRVSFALTGIGPTPGETSAFVADDSQKAYSKVVDRLLASPRFGERMTQDWLDVARYADTYGYQSDVDRSVWPYRDWVIRAFNQNLRYDDFVTWQLAGDLLPNPTRDQRLATAFCRLHRQTNEGGSVEEEYRVEYVSDRTETAATAFLGLTIGCAQCHDHKFDPIKQADFYRMSAFFDNIDESGLYSHFTRAVPTPTLLLTNDAQRRHMNKLRGQIRDSEAALRKLRRSRGEAFSKWIVSSASKTKTLIPGRIGHYTLDDLGSGLANRVDPKNKKQNARASGGPKQVSGVKGQAVLLDGENNLNFPVGRFRRTDAFTIALWLRVPERMKRAVVFHRSRAWTDSGSQGYQLLLEDGRLSASLIHFWPGNAIRVRSVEPMPVGEWVHVAMTYDGSSKATGLRIYENGERVPVSTIRDNLYKSIGNNRLTIGQRFRDNGLKGGSVDEFQVFSRELSRLEIADLHGEGELAARIAIGIKHGRGRKDSDPRLYEYYLANSDTAMRETRRTLKIRRVELAKMRDSVPEIMTMRERPEPRSTYVLERGSYEARGQRVKPGTPASLLPFPKDQPRNRLGLARWLTHPDHPLTARVAVNRLWHIVFGRGIVPTLENFGSQGDAPSHPKLLDCLALEFIESGWDVKAMLGRIVLTATYRQASRGSRGRVTDPENTMFSRGPSMRLAAEMLRDHALHAGGLLVEKIGGPSVKPYQPPGLWKEKSGRVYRADKGDGLFRRSLYTFWKRTSPPPSMMIFDAAKRDVCVARRQVTNTPLQALVLLNDPQCVEASRLLATRVIREEKTVDARIRAAFRHLASRAPTDREMAVLERLLARQFEKFKADPEAATAFLTVGSRPVDKGVNKPILAAYAVVCSTILNYDAAVVVR